MTRSRLHFSAEERKLFSLLHRFFVESENSNGRLRFGGQTGYTRDNNKTAQRGNNAVCESGA